MARRRMQRGPLFDKPARATGLGLVACYACAAIGADLFVTTMATVIAALFGCFNG